MKVSVLKEEGHELALRGMSYSFKDRATPVDAWWNDKRQQAERRADLLADKDGGHNAFLEAINVWIDIDAPRCWWSEMDRYRVGKTQLSESSMHTLAKRPPSSFDFESDTPTEIIAAFHAVWHSAKGDIATLKCALPEGYLQRRLVVVNYKCLRNILAQRKGHRLKYWSIFNRSIIEQVQHPSYLTNTLKEAN